MRFKTRAEFKKVIDEQAAVQTGAAPIVFNGIVFDFGNFQKVNLANCHFINCRFTQTCLFNRSADLKNTRFTGSHFEQGVFLHSKDSHGDVGLGACDYQCDTFFIYDNSENIQYSSITTAQLMEGFLYYKSTSFFSSHATENYKAFDTTKPKDALKLSLLLIEDAEKKSRTNFARMVCRFAERPSLEAAKLCESHERDKAVQSSKLAPTLFAPSKGDETKIHLNILRPVGGYLR